MILSAPRRSLRWLLSLIVDLLERLLILILASGPIPNHVAFVMDGNRRYAGKKGKQIHEGHRDGFLALHRMLAVCMRLRVHSVSVFAFAIENFGRSPSEVDALWLLCEEKLNELCKHGELLEQYGVRLKVLGKTNLLPRHVRDAARRAETLTRHHDKAILNIMMPYSSRDEMATALQSIVRRALEGVVNPIDIKEDTIDNELFTTLAGNPPVDILVRTSGAKRFSDFLNWQCCENTQIHFTPNYWPDFGLRELVPILLDFQRKVWSRGLTLSP